MIITGIIIGMLNFIIMGAVLFVDFTIYSKAISVSGTSSKKELQILENTEPLKAQVSTTFKPAA